MKRGWGINCNPNLFSIYSDFYFSSLFTPTISTCFTTPPPLPPLLSTDFSPDISTGFHIHVNVIILKRLPPT